MDQKTPNGPEKHLGGAPWEHHPAEHAWAPRSAQVGYAHLGGLPHRLFTL